MAISYSGGATNNTFGSNNSVSLTYTLTSGRCAIVVAATNLTGQTISSMTSTGSTFSRLVGPLDDGAQAIEIWGTTATGTGSGTSTSVTWTAGASGRRGAIIIELAGVVEIGTSGTISGTGTSPTITLTTQDADNWVVAGLKGLYDPSITASVGTLRQFVNAGSNLAIACLTNTAALPGSVTNTGTQADSAAWIAAAIELRSQVTSLSSMRSLSIPPAIMCM